ncbi:FecR family protein [Pseudomonas sp. LRF_L74]|uniref:FecR family protein n=1 Tax=Pseudomonas sp. LRF_L74 TaxID=3369422 RepID=UPI003F6228BF
MSAQPLSDEELDKPLPPRVEEALQWLVRLHDGSANDADWAAYTAWTHLSAEHQSASAAAEQLWQALGNPPLQRKPRRWPVVALVLAVACSALGWRGHDQGWMADIRTGSGEKRELRLPDGSTLELAPETRVDLDLGARQRVVRLYAGELHVQVAADPTRPFLVEAASGSVRALGTGFDVQREDDHVQVVVTEHSVRVSQASEGHSSEVDLQTGESVSYDDNGLATVRPVDVSRATAWRRDRLVFDGQPLGEVLDTLAHYRDGLIVIRDKRLRELPVTGIFSTKDTDAQLQLLEKSLPIRIRQYPWLTLVEPRE